MKKFDRGLRDWKFLAIDRGLKFSIEPFSLHYEGPVDGNSGIQKFSIEIENFDRDWKFRAGIENFDRDWIFSIIGPSGIGSQRFKIAIGSNRNPQIRSNLKRCFRGSLHGGANFEVESAHFAAWKIGSREPQKWSKLAPPCAPPPEALYSNRCDVFTIFHMFRFFSNLKDTPSLKLLVDFGVWFPQWIFLWIFRGFFSGDCPWKNKQEKIHQKIHDFQVKIHSGKFLPWQIARFDSLAIRFASGSWFESCAPRHLSVKQKSLRVPRNSRDIPKGPCPNLVVSNLVVCNFYADALFCALLRPFAPFCALLRPFALFANLHVRCFALICTLLRTFACFCERPRLGTAELRRGKLTMRSEFAIAQRFAMVTPPALTQISWVLRGIFPPPRGFTA